MTARTSEYRGHVVDDHWMARSTRRQLRELADEFPVGSRIVHACGREGTVALDQPEHVPGVFDGHPTAVCLLRGVPMVFAHWDNESGLVWGVWVPAAKLRQAKAPAVNRPGNKALIGGRR